MASLFKRPNGVYYLITNVNGRQVWKSTGARSKREAQKIIREGFKKVQPTPPRLTLTQFIPQFLAYAETNFARTTVLLYKEAIEKFKSILGDFPLSAYTTHDVEEFKSKRLKQVSMVTVNINFRTLRAFFQTAVRWKVIDENPFRGVKQIKVPPRRPIYLSKEAFKCLLGTINLPWYKELVVFAVSTMMRAGEIVSLQWKSVDLRRRIIMVENTDEFRIKTTKPRVIPMNDWVIGLLAPREQKEGHVFTFPDGKRLTVAYVSHRFKKYVIKAGLPGDLHFHSLRHTGATWLVQDGVSIYAVQRLLGHSSISVTQVYSHLEVDSLFQSVARISIPAEEHFNPNPLGITGVEIEEVKTGATDIENAPI
jgi:site-specific recombinase XerD